MRNKRVLVMDSEPLRAALILDALMHRYIDVAHVLRFKEIAPDGMSAIDVAVIADSYGQRDPFTLAGDMKQRMPHCAIIVFLTNPAYDRELAAFQNTPPKGVRVVESIPNWVKDPLQTLIDAGWAIRHAVLETLLLQDDSEAAIAWVKAFGAYFDSVVPKHPQQVTPPEVRDRLEHVLPTMADDRLKSKEREFIEQLVIEYKSYATDTPPQKPQQTASGQQWTMAVLEYKLAVKEHALATAAQLLDKLRRHNVGQKNALDKLKNEMIDTAVEAHRYRDKLEEFKKRFRQQQQLHKERLAKLEEDDKQLRYQLSRLQGQLEQANGERDRLKAMLDDFKAEFDDTIH